ncbi:MAG TPA: ankyrin repeat domain-containing protein [Treponema sp.]|mgnify:FL=1|nr:ankyrin repeat domain-containing protein [Treponema sp.]
MRKRNIIGIIFPYFLCFMISGLGAQSIKDDLISNNIEGLQTKIKLLDQSLKDGPYIATYLKYSKQYDQKMLDFLLSNGANPDQVDENGVGPLYYAIAGNNYDAVITLINAKANVNAAWKKTKDSYWEYDFGISREQVYELPIYNSKTNEFINDYSIRGTSTLRPLAAALYSKNPDIVTALLTAGADPLGSLYLIKDKKGAITSSNTVFDHIIGRFAVSNGSISQINLDFFANAAKVWKAVMSLPVNKRPVIAANSQKNVFFYLLSGLLKDFKGELSKTYYESNEYIPYAALTGNWELVDFLLQFSRIGIDDPYMEGEQSILGWALSNLYIDTAQFLLEHGASIPDTIRAVSKDEFTIYTGDITYTPLEWSVINSKLNLVKLLLDKKIDLTKDTSLFYAYHAPAIRNVLIDGGANTDIVREFRDDYGFFSVKGTLLFGAVYNNDLESLAYYLDRGLDPNGNNLANPLIVAVSRNTPEMVKLLLEKGANPDVTINRAMYAIFCINYGGGSADFTGKKVIEYARYMKKYLTKTEEAKKIDEIIGLLEGTHS